LSSPASDLEISSLIPLDDAATSSARDSDSLEKGVERLDAIYIIRR
jgi:hypothetical protein